MQNTTNVFSLFIGSFAWSCLPFLKTFLTKHRKCPMGRMSALRIVSMMASSSCRRGGAWSLCCTPHDRQYATRAAMVCGRRSSSDVLTSTHCCIDVSRGRSSCSSSGGEGRKRGQNRRVIVHGAAGGDPGKPQSQGDLKETVLVSHALLQRTRPLNTARMVKVSHILLTQSVDVVDMVRDRLCREANEAGSVDEMKERFAALAKEYSSCPSGKNGGDLGWVSTGAMVQEFEDACFRSVPGELVECDTEYGHHVIYIEAEREQGEVKPMSVEELSQLLVTGATESLELDKVQLLDVREPAEVDMASLPGFWKVYSLSQFGEWGPNVAYMLDPDMTTIVLCHHGVRSAQVCQFLLRSHQFKDLRNVTGGIAAYSRMDPTIPEY